LTGGEGGEEGREFIIKAVQSSNIWQLCLSARWLFWALPEHRKRGRKREKKREEKKKLIYAFLAAFS